MISFNHLLVKILIEELFQHQHDETLFPATNICFYSHDIYLESCGVCGTNGAIQFQRWSTVDTVDKPMYRR